MLIVGLKLVGCALPVGLDVTGATLTVGLVLVGLELVGSELVGLVEVKTTTGAELIVGRVDAVGRGDIVGA